MKKVILIILVVIFYGCASSIQINFTSKTPDKISDSVIDISFTPESKSICFELKNNSDKRANVLWDKSAILINGQTKKIFHNGVKFSDISESLPPSLIPPGGILSDCIVPCENATLTANGWYITPMVRGDEAKTEIKAYLVIEVGGIEKEYTFTAIGAPDNLEQ